MSFCDALPMTSAYFRLILREQGRSARARAALLEGTGLPDEAPPGEITLGQQLRQIRNANRVLEPGWALAMGARFHAATHGPIGVAAASAPTLRASLDVITRFSRVRSPHFQLTAERRGAEIRLVPTDRVELDRGERRALLDIVMLSTQGLLESALGRPMREGRFEFPYPRPAYARCYDEDFHAATRFDCREAAVVIPVAWLPLDCPLADAVLFETSWRSLAAGERRLDGDCAAARVEQLVTERGERLGSRTAARLMGVSSRTLARRLRAEGTGYRSLVETRRRSRVEALLRDPTLTIAEVAYAVGYEDAANFGRACRRWFGTSPGRHRERLQRLDALSS